MISSKYMRARITRVSILSFSEVEDVYPITYIPFEGFMVHMQDRDVMFN
jgi:hypothetical protein